jgi:hypothetical protein
MAGVTIKTSLQSNLLQVLPRMLHDPWTVATFVDFYFNILILWSWVLYKENSFVRSFFWLVAFIGLGSIATSGYVFLQLSRLKPGDTLNQLWAKRI